MFSKLKAEQDDDDDENNNSETLPPMSTRRRNSIEQNENKDEFANTIEENSNDEEASVPELKSLNSSTNLNDLSPSLTKQQVASSHFLQKWGVIQNEKVIEVEEETSVLNRTNRITTKRSKQSTSVKNPIPIEEFPKLNYKIVKKSQKEIKILPTNTLSIKLKQKPKKQTRNPFQSNKKRQSARPSSKRINEISSEKKVQIDQNYPVDQLGLKIND